MKRRIRQLVNALSALVVTVGLGFPALASAATTSRIYISPAQFAGSNGSNVSVPVRVDPGGNEIDTVAIKVSFPESQLTFQSIDKGGSAFDTFVPSAPKASNGVVEFSAALLGKSVTSDSLVGTLVFASKASSGSATLDLGGSAAARSGSMVNVNTENASVAFSPNGVLPGKIGITDISVSDVTVNSATIRWKTAVASTSSVDYGPSTRYGSSAGSTELTTDHSVKLSPIFAGNMAVHFAVTSRDSSGSTQTSDDNTFTTLGYTINLKISDKSGKALAGAKVKVADLAPVKADANGVATVSNVAPGSQKVIINGGKAQMVAVKAVRGVNASAVQHFDVTAEPKPLLPRLLLGLLIIGLIAVAVWMWRKRQGVQASNGKQPTES